MFHVIAFTGSVANVANTALAPIVDRFITSDATGFMFSEDRDLLWGHIRGATLYRGRLTAPALREITFPFICPILEGLASQRAPNVADYRNNPFRVKRLERLNIENTGGNAMAEAHYGVLGVKFDSRPAPRGQVFTLRGTTVQVVPVDVWTLGAIVWADTLPQGTYAVLGLEALGTGLVAARLVFENQLWNPGCVAINDYGDITHPMFRMGELGEWGRFTTYREPQVEFLAHTQAAPIDIKMDIVRVG